MDHGKLTDHNGKSVDFRNVILIMTSNVGAMELQKSPIGFGRKREAGDDGSDQPDVHAGIPQPARRHHLLRPAAPGRGAPGGREVRAPARRPARRAWRHHQPHPEAAEWLAIRGYDERMGAARSAASSRSTSRSRWPTRSCSASWWNGGQVTVAVVGVGPDAKLGLSPRPRAPPAPRPSPAPRRPRRRPRPKKELRARP